MNIKILFPIACLMACTPKSEPQQEKTVWQKLVDAGKKEIFGTEPDFKNFGEKAMKLNKEFKGGYDDIINMINNGLNNKKAGDVRNGIITELIKRAGNWIFRYPIA